MEMSKKLKDLFTINYHEGDGVISTIDNDIIVKKDNTSVDEINGLIASKTPLGTICRYIQSNPSEFKKIMN